jgi:prephenate dehydratase
MTETGEGAIPPAPPHTSDSGIGTVAIIGLGLIGGSLARDLAAAGLRIAGFDRDARTMADAHAAGVLAATLGESLDGIDDADVVVLAVPVSDAVTLLADVARRCTRARLVTDVGSTKATLAEAAAAAGLAARFVGGHPLAGDDRAGWSASRPGLFAGARVYLCPTAESSPDAVALAEQLWRTVGAHTERRDAGAHDRMLAFTSHLPQLLSTALAAALGRAGIPVGELGPGGRAMTRLAGSSPAMWVPIAAENGPRIAAAFDSLDAVVAPVHEALRHGDHTALRRFFDDGHRWATAAIERPLAAREEAANAAADIVAENIVAEKIVAFQGELGAHSEAAVRAYFSAVTPLPCRSFRDVADAVLDGRAARGVLPVENSSAGTVVGAYEVLAMPGLTIVGETVRPIRHALLGVQGAAPGRLRRVLSHPVALAQCSHFFACHRWIEAVAFYDTAGAALEIARIADPALAALAPEEAAARYGLSVLERDVHDRSDNVTRFVVIAREDAYRAAESGSPRARSAPAAAEDGHPVRSALLVDVHNAPGALSRVLQPFAERGVDLTHIQSTPGAVPFTYRFIMEVAADVRRGAAADAVAETRAAGADVRVLGCFNRAGTD